MKMIINKNYTKLLSATFITRLGDSIDTIAFSWLVYTMTGSRVLMGSIFAISVLPNIIVLPFAGAFADVFCKKTITVLGDVLRGVSVTVLALFYFFGILEVWHLFVFVVLNSIFESFANPARRSMLPSIIEEDDYMKGTSWRGTASDIGSLVGLSLAGILIAVIGIWGAILIDAITFFVSAIFIFSMNYVDKRSDELSDKKHSLKDFFILIKQGFAYLMNKKIVFALVLLTAFINFVFVPYNVLGPIYVVEVLGLGVEGLSYLGIAFLVGMIFGGYLMGIKGKNLNPIKAIGLGLSLSGVMYMLLGLPGFVHLGKTSTLIFVLIVSFLFGGLIPVIQSPIRTAILKTIAPEMIGRLLSIMAVISLCAMPLGGLLVSVIGDSLSVPIFYIIMGFSAVVVSFGFWGFARNKVIS